MFVVLSTTSLTTSTIISKTDNQQQQKTKPNRKYGNEDMGAGSQTWIEQGL